MTEQQQRWLRHLPVEGVLRNRLKVALVLAGLDVTEIAVRTGLRPQYVSAVATGRLGNISLRNAQRLVSCFPGLGIEDLFPPVESADEQSDEPRDPEAH